MMLCTYLTEDLTSFLTLFHIQGAKGDPWGTLGIVVVVGLVLILRCRKKLNGVTEYIINLKTTVQLYIRFIL